VTDILPYLYCHASAAFWRRLLDVMERNTWRLARRRACPSRFLQAALAGPVSNSLTAAVVVIVAIMMHIQKMAVCWIIMSINSANLLCAPIYRRRHTNYDTGSGRTGQSFGLFSPPLNALI